MNLDSLRGDETALRKELESAGARFKGRACKCVFCDDAHPSAGIYIDDGVCKFKCHKCGFGGDLIDVRAKLNKRTVADELRAINDQERPAKREPAPKVYPTFKELLASLPNVEDSYHDLYEELDGTHKFVVVRWRRSDGSKGFTQCSATAGGWWMRAPQGLLPIANRKGVAASDTVVMVEGEKALRALLSLGIVATTAPGGALNGAKSDLSPLAGKMVILWPDNDPATDEYPHGKGYEHMKQIQKMLAHLDPAPRIMWLDIGGLELPPKGDAFDLVERYRKTQKPDVVKALIEDVLADASPVGIAAEYKRELEAVIAGKRRAIGFPWFRLTASSRALMPGKVTCICGDAGSGKSLMVSNCVADWHEVTKSKVLNIRFAVYHLEDDRNYHLQRLHAQLARSAVLTDPDWIEANGDFARGYFEKYHQDIEHLGRCIWEAPDEQVSLEMLTTWIEERAKAGADIIIIDPVTAAAAVKMPWIEDLKFITKAKVIARKYGCRVIFVTHPRTGTKSGKASHNDMAGGAAYPRFAHTVLWLERNDQETVYSVKGEDGVINDITPNRILHVSKARNGPGAGRRIAFNFNRDTLLFEELGLIEKNQV